MVHISSFFVDRHYCAAVSVHCDGGEGVMPDNPFGLTQGKHWIYLKRKSWSLTGTLELLRDSYCICSHESQTRGRVDSPKARIRLMEEYIHPPQESSIQVKSAP